MVQVNEEYGSYQRLITAIDGLSAFGNYVAGLSLLAILAMMSSEILSRNILGVSLAFSWEFSAYAMGAAFMLASAGAMRAGAHVRVTAVLEVVPTPVARLLEFAACIVGGLACLALAWALCEMTWLSLQRGSTSSTVMRTPLVWPQGLAAFGAVVLVLQCLAQFLRLLRGERIAVGVALE
ncbi:TRAP transporter small permease subunit [Tropicimonas sp. IMCC6043]|uniref:TRAP transporter small permease subunit n=1 Tax=Tropicimonas sp. IMCC6043 TaxID=2510645 RepID=UPI00101DAD48|nr:TRAP transporter small permease [Tropicimonas sp. IMCC6043]RYH06080.1 TRAP transporter small permease [Tropicimonas sp. IMCC6043]